MPASPLNLEELKARIIAELNIGHLPAEEQDQVINTVSQVLLKRATLAIMQRIPAEKLDELDKLSDAQDSAAIQKLVAEYVPDAEAVATQAAQEGLAEHKRLVAELVTQG